MQNLLNYSPNLFASVLDQPGYKTRRERMAEVRAARLVREEEEKKKKELEDAQTKIVSPIDQSGPDGPRAGNVPPSAPSFLPNYNIPGMIGGLLGGPVGAVAGNMYGVNMANRDLDKLMDVTQTTQFGPQTLGFTDAVKGSLGGLVGTSINDAFDNALDARSDAVQSANYGKLGYDFDTLSIDQEMKAAIDPYNVDIRDNMPAFDSLNTPMSFDDLMAIGGMSQPGQTFDDLPDVGPNGKWDFSDLDEFGNPTLSYDSFGDWMEDLEKSLSDDSSSSNESRDPSDSGPSYDDGEDYF